MPRKLKKYSSFKREILAEFVSTEQLEELDVQYAVAKLEKVLRSLKKTKINKPFFGKILERSDE